MMSSSEFRPTAMAIISDTEQMEGADTRTKNVIRRHCSQLSNQLAVSSDLLLSVSVGFYQCNIIDRVTKADINNKGGLVGADILLTHIHMKVEQSPEDYLVTVMNVLRDEVTLRDTVRKMEDYLPCRVTEREPTTEATGKHIALEHVHWNAWKGLFAQCFLFFFVSHS